MQSYYFLPKIFLRKCDFRRPEPVAERFAGRFMVVSGRLAGGGSPGRSPGLSGVYFGGSLIQDLETADIHRFCRTGRGGGIRPEGGG